MPENQAKYHTTLALYFSAQPNFFDGDQQKKPHIRKCMEQPWQQTKAEFWNEVIETLCNLHFIQAKCIAGMTFELVKDYIDTFEVLPDAKDEAKKNAEQKARIQKLVDDLIAYSKGEINSIGVLESIEPWNTDKIIEDNTRIIQTPTRLDRVKTYFQFVNSESHILFKYGQQAGFNVLQHAFNYTGNGSLAESVNKLITPQIENKRWKDPLIRVRGDYNPHKAQIRILDNHKFPVHAIALSFNGDIVISGGGDNEFDNHLRVWNANNGTYLFALHGHERPVKSIALTPDGRMAASAGEDKTIRVWDIEKRICTHVMTGHQEDIISLALSVDGRIIVSGGRSEKIKIWSGESGECILTLDGETDCIRTIILSADSKYIISAGGYAITHLGFGQESEYSIRIWDTKTGNCLKILKGHENCIETMASTTDNKKLVSGSFNGEIRIWDVETGVCRAIIDTGFGPIYALALTSDGKYALSSHLKSGIIHLWNMESQALLKSFHGHLDTVWAVALTPDGQLAVSAGGIDSLSSGKNDYSIRVWNITNGITDESKNIHLNKVHSVAITPDSKFAISGGGDPDETKREMVGTPNLWVWDLESNERVRTLRLSCAEQVVPVFNSSNILAAAERSIFIYDVLSGKELRSILAQQSGIWAAAITPDGQRAVFGCGGAVQVWDMISAKCQFTFVDKLPYGSGGVNALALTPDGSQVVSSSDGNLFVWNVYDGRCIQTYQGKDVVSAVAFTPDGRLFVSSIRGDYDNRPDSFLRVWDINSGKCSQTLEGHLDGVNSLAITPDGKYAVSGGGGVNHDYSIRIWEIKTGQCIHALEGHTDQITSLAVSSDGMRVFSISNDRTLRIWDIKSGTCLNISAHFSVITAFSLKNNIFAMGYRSGNVHLFDCFDSIIPLITAALLFHADSNTWDESPTALCAYCGQRFIIPAAVHKIIVGINSDLNMSSEKLPCQNLPPEAWNDPGLLTECPHCGKKLKFNPFIADRRNSVIENSKNIVNE
jgi:WD40 repeat protein